MRSEYLFIHLKGYYEAGRTPHNYGSLQSTYILPWEQYRWRARTSIVVGREMAKNIFWAHDHVNRTHSYTFSHKGKSIFPNADIRRRESLIISLRPCENNH